MILKYDKTEDFIEENVDCIICGDSETTYYDKIFDRTFVQCKTCGLVFQDPRIKKNLLWEKGRVLYDKSYFYNKENTKKKVKKARKNLYEIELEKLRTFCNSKPIRIFDVGCGTGRFLGYLPNDWEKHGCDITPRGVEIARDTYGLKNIMLGEFESLDIRENYYDVVYFRASLHHIYNPLSSLKKAHKILGKNGCLAIMTNCRTGWSGKLLRCSTRTVNPRVTYFFDEITIGILLKRTGFELKTTHIPYWGSGYESIWDFPQLMIAAFRKHVTRPVLNRVGVRRENDLVGPAWHKNAVIYFCQKKIK